VPDDCSAQLAARALAAHAPRSDGRQRQRSTASAIAIVQACAGSTPAACVDASSQGNPYVVA